jgi:hypothetical protein
MESGRVNANLSLEEVRRELDVLAERRLNGPWTDRELHRWEELIAVEESLLGPEEKRHR